MSLIEKLRARLEVPPRHERSSPSVYAGHELEHMRIKPTLELMLKVIEAADKAFYHIPELEEALADLERSLK